MAKFNKQVARELLAELQECVKGTPDRIDRAPDEGPVIDLICEALGKAISAMKTTVR